MAKSLQQLSNSIITSVFGRRLGMDIGGYLVGPPDMKVQTQVATSLTTSSAIDPHGITSLAATSAATYAMSAPVEGVEKKLVCTSTGAGNQVVQLPTGVTFQTTAGTSFNQATFSGVGQSADLVGLSTSLYAAIGTASCAFSTF